MRGQLQSDARAIVGANTSPPIAPYAANSPNPFNTGSDVSPNVDDWSADEMGEDNSYNTYEQTDEGSP